MIDEIVREGARRMPAAALEAEVNAYIAELAEQRDDSGRRLVVRNGFHQPRKVTTAAGAIEVKAPRVNDKRVDEATGERKRFSSAILPPWARKSPKISEVLPLLYLRAPALAVGDGALGFWNALNEVFPETRHQRCWAHKTANVLDALAKSGQPAAKRAIQALYRAEDKEHAAKAIAAFAKQYGAKYPKVVKRLTDDEGELLAFFDFPAEHWSHLRTTNPIESTFATVRLRTKVTKDAGSRVAALDMVFKLIESAQERWRAVNAPHLVALVRAGARFERGHLVERPEAVAA
ncbi:transposase [Streptomyces cacaoi]|uniref:transposase n=1 Tax=Streptomyces cacaoi TaxID=1898 RepID=UPI00374A4CE5